jgi:cytochrome bd ubiquinol oxidase subunit I
MFESVDSLILARMQFAANISFHILFPSISIALAWVLLFFKWRYRKTQNKAWMDAYALWVKIFALTFALGVVSGITMSFQFGTNWPGYMETVGNIAGPLLAYEVLTAFFLEATFLGIMLFGRERVGERMHTLATFLVAFGTSMSAFWIIVLNSWMHTPAGFEMINGQAHATDWMAIVFNPSMPYRLTHMLLASGLTVAFLLAGLSAYRLLRDANQIDARITLKAGVYLAAILIPIQIFVGDMHGLNTKEYQPAKIAAIEAVWETQNGAPLTVFGFPDEEKRTTHAAIEVPKLASLVLTRDLNGEIKGLNEFEGKHPPVAPVFWAFRVMVGIGMAMLLVSWWCVWSLRRNAIKALHYRVLQIMTFSGWIALLSGWYVTEIGRQPWLVHGVLTTASAVSNVATPMVASTLIMYSVMYVFLLMSYLTVLFYLARKANDKTLTLSPATTNNELQHA